MPDKKEKPDSKSDKTLDEGLAETFPASDPPAEIRPPQPSDKKKPKSDKD